MAGDVQMTPKMTLLSAFGGPGPVQDGPVIVLVWFFIRLAVLGSLFCICSAPFGIILGCSYGRFGTSWGRSSGRRCRLADLNACFK